LTKACAPELLGGSSGQTLLTRIPRSKRPENLPASQKFASVLQGNLRRNLREASFAVPGWFVYLKIENPQTH
jgi:hypothetical protein